MSDTMRIVGTVTNAYGNKWYVVDYQDDVKKMMGTLLRYGYNIGEIKDGIKIATDRAKQSENGENNE